MILWRLDDAAERVRIAPTTGPIPPEEVRVDLQLGWHAKIVFVPENPNRHRFTEALWVRITKRQTGADELTQKYTGILESKPESVPGLERGEVIQFEPKNVVDYIDIQAKARGAR